MGINKNIELKASKLLAGIWKTVKAPIKLEKVAESLGLMLREEDLDQDVSGLLYINKGNATIGVNMNHGERRKRFTIAHEIGHFVLHRLESNLFLDTKASQVVLYRKNENLDANYIQEREANEFAAALLMPKELVLKELDKSGMSFDFGEDMTDNKQIKDLANKFEVSSQAMNFRIMNILSNM